MIFLYISIAAICATFAVNRVGRYLRSPDRLRHLPPGLARTQAAANSGELKQHPYRALSAPADVVGANRRGESPALAMAMMTAIHFTEGTVECVETEETARGTRVVSIVANSEHRYRFDVRRSSDPSKSAITTFCLSGSLTPQQVSQIANKK